MKPTDLPNLVTALRIVLALPVAWLLLAEAPRAWSVVIFAIAAATDWLDGWLARKLSAASVLGAVFDPIADKLLVAAVLLALVANGDIAGWHVAAAVLVVTREILVSGLREALAPQGLSLPVSLAAKGKTAAQLVALLLLLAGFGWPGLVVLWLSALLGWATALDYLGRGLVMLRAPPNAQPGPVP